MEGCIIAHFSLVIITIILLIIHRFNESLSVQTAQGPTDLFSFSIDTELKSIWG